MIKRTKVHCSCSNVNCARHGDCDACKDHHQAKGSKTACERSH